MFFRKKTPEILVIQDFIDPDDLLSILDFLKNNQFMRAHQNQMGRNNFELFTENKNIADIIYKKSKRTFKLIEKPNILEFYSYEKGDFLTAHSDKPTKFDSHQNSNYTAIIYLNDDFVGGETYFSDKNEIIYPKAGNLLLFQHQLRHEGKVVELGTKYIFRSNWKIK